jgi:uncharacterized cupin superfamily protein
VGRSNVFNAELQPVPEEAGFRAGFATVGADAGAKHLGASVYELETGRAAFPYHFHRANEELLVVLRGRPTLRTPEGERELAEGEVVAFRPGPTGAHQVINRSSETVRYVMFSTKRSPEMLQYPDSGKVGVGTLPQEGDEGPVRLMFRVDSAVDYYDGEEAPS